MISHENPKVNSLLKCLHGSIDQEERCTMKGDKRGAELWSKEVYNLASQIYDLISLEGKIN